MKVISFAILGLAACYAQTSPPTAAFTGRVTGMSGEPLKNASVHFVPAPSGPGEAAAARERYTFITGADGRFTSDSLPRGRYSIHSTRSGYMDDSRYLTIDPAQPQPELSIQLTPLGLVEGKVTDEDGEPVRGTILVGNFPSVEISADGTYVASVKPGRYTVQARPDSSSIGAEVIGTWPREIASPTYYPDSIASSGATKVEVRAGAVVRGIDIRIREVTTYAVRGHAIDGTSGKPAVHMPIQLIPNGDYWPDEMLAATTLDDGAFEFRDVRAGTYRIQPFSSVPVDARLYWVRPVVVGKRNVEDLEMTLQRGAEIRGKIRMESGEPVKLPSRWVVSMAGAGNSVGIPVTDDGSFVRSDIEPGEYTFRMFTGPPQTYVKSIRLNQQEIGAAEGHLDAGTTGVVEVVLSTHVAEVGGTIRGSDGGPVRGVRVTLWTTDRTTGVSELVRNGIATTDANGVFRVGDLAPGDYRIAAWENSPDVSRLRSEFLNQFDHRAATVSLQEDQRLNVEVPLIPRDAIDRAEGIAR